MKKLTPYLLLVPQLILGTVFITGIVIGITQSLGVIPIFKLYTPTLMYYKEILGREASIDGIVYSFKIAGISAILSILIGIFMCYILINTGRNGLINAIVKLPIIVPHTIVALMIINVMSQNGLLARILFHLNIISDQSDFPLLINDAGGVGVILAYMWKEAPFVIYFVITLMAAISSNLGEAAINLGASRLIAFIKVSLPLCIGNILSAFLIIFVYALGAYELPQILGATLPKALPILSYIEFQKPDLRLRPYAMAYNGVLTVISVFAAIVYFRLMKKSSEKFGGANEKK